MENISLLLGVFLWASFCLVIANSNVPWLKFVPILVVTAISFFLLLVFIDSYPLHSEALTKLLGGLICTNIFGGLVCSVAYRQKDGNRFWLSWLLFTLRWTLFMLGLGFFLKFGLVGKGFLVIGELAVFSAVWGTTICALTFQRNDKDKFLISWRHYFIYFFFSIIFLCGIYSMLIFIWGMRPSH